MSALLLLLLALAPAASADSHICTASEAEWCQPGELVVEGEDLPLTPEQELENREGEREEHEPGAVVEIEGDDGAMIVLTPAVEERAASGNGAVVSAPVIAKPAAHHAHHHRRHHRRRHHHRGRRT